MTRATIASHATRGFSVRHCDVLVVGAGAAGLSCALAAAPLKVTLVTKTAFAGGGNTPWAQGGLAAAVGEDDSGALHARDTLAAGAGLCDEATVDRLVMHAPAHVRRLLALGTRFDRAADGSLALGREAAHSRPRILHANGDGTGAEIARALSDAVRASAHLTIAERTAVDELVVADGGLAGAWTTDAGGRRVLFLARAVVLATGGIGQLFRHTTNPPEATGDGIALAARAGAVLADLEFLQFHPTALDVSADPLPLVTEALRGAGAALVDETGRRFVFDAHPDGELAPRDIVARAIWAHATAGHRVLLDARAAVGDAFPRSFPTVFETCRRHGVDPRVQPMPVTPAAHYHMGGVLVDAHGRTSMDGLWACGEVACTGVHGANRLASNSLLEAIVFGAGVAEAILSGGTVRHARAAERARARADAARLSSRRVSGPYDVPGAVTSAQDSAPHSDITRIRQLMWDWVGLVRSAEGLSAAARELAAFEHSSPSRRVRDLALIGRLVATTALAREESRGGHYRSDFPHTRDDWRRRSLVRLSPCGAVEALPPASDRNPVGPAAPGVLREGAA